MGRDTTKIVIGLVMIAVALIVFPLVMTAANEILQTATIADYTGLETLVAIAPLLIFISLIAGGGWLTFAGFKARAGGGGGGGGGGRSRSRR